MNSGKINLRFLAVICATAVVSCTKSLEPERPSGIHKIDFTDEGVYTRGESDDTLTPGYELFPVGAEMGVFAYELPDSVFDELEDTPDLLYNAQLKKLDKGSYIYNPVAHWPGKGKVLFAAYHPHSASLTPGVITVSPYTSAGLPEITVELGRTKEKVDFSVALLEPVFPTTGEDPVGTPGRSDYNVNFRFKRKLAELFFRAKAVDMDDSTINLYINTISVKHIYTKGTYSFRDDKWNNLSGDADGVTGATLTLSSAGFPVSKNEFTDIANPSNDGSDRSGSIVMLPQSYNNIELDITYTIEYLKADGGCEYVVIGNKKVPLTIKWEAGKMYCYDMEFGLYEAYGEPVPFKFTIKEWETKDIPTIID